MTQLTCQVLFDRVFDLSPDDTPLVTVDDVEQVIPGVLEAGGHAFQWIWDGLPPAERIIFSAIAGQTGEGTVLSADDITTVLQEAGIRILVKELNLATETLVSWQMLEQVDGGYRFFVELMRRWVIRYRPLDKVKDELDRINPLADNLYQAAQGFYQQGNNERAVAQLRQAVEANPNHLKVHLLLGTILREEGRLAEAVAEFEEAFRLDEREGRFELLRALLQQGEGLEATGDEEGALAAYNRALAISPREQTAQMRKAALWVKRGDQALAANNFEAALEAYRQAGADEKLAQVKTFQFKIELERAAVEAQACETREEWAKAAGVYRRLTQLDPDDERWRQALKRAEEELWLAERYAEGAGYVQQEDWVNAQKTLAGVISKRPDYRDAAELLALAKRRGKEPEPMRALRRRLSLAAAIGGVVFLLAAVGVWTYSQTQIQTQATHMADLAATAAAQATAAEIDAATQVAVAVQGTQLAELQATQAADAKITQAAEAGLTATAEAAVQAAQTAEAETTQSAETGLTATAVAVARATQTTEAGHTATAAAIATQTAQAPIATPTSTRTPRPTSTSTPTATPVPASAILYFEDFEDGVADGWGNTKGTWLVEEDESRNRIYVGTGPDDYPQAWLLGTEWADYAFESRIRFINGGAFICVRVGFDSGDRGFYTAMLSTVDNWAHLALWDGADYSELVGTDFTLVEDRWYIVRVEVEGSGIRLFIDDRLILTHEDPVRSRGGIGYYMGGGGKVEFDDIRVWTLGSYSESGGLESAPSVSSESSGDFIYAAPINLVINPTGDNNFSFNWVWDGSLKGNEFFELRVWSGDGPHWGGAAPTKALEATVNMFILARGDAEFKEQPGRFIGGARDALRPDLVDATSFCASVAVITKEPYTSLSPESNVVCWNWP